MKKTVFGIACCIGIAIPSWFLGMQLPVIGGPVFAILIGMMIGHFVPNKTKLQPGLTFTSKKILQYSVILLGFGMNFKDILTQGSKSIPIILSTISTSLIITYLLYRRLHLDKKIATLIGVGSSICGGSAIAATAPVIEAEEHEIAQAISVIFLFNIIAALIFPTLGSMLHLSNEGFAIFAGSAINDTSSVTAAASSWDSLHNSNTLAYATIVKLIRTLAIIPITLVLAFLQSKQANKKGASTFQLRRVFPYFVLFFLLASLITTFTSLPLELTSAFTKLSKFMIVMAMSAIGFNTNLVQLIKTGGKPILLGFACWISIATICLMLQYTLGLY